MYCGQCGKKVMDNMLFCPFCGSPIVIPDQDAAETCDEPVQATEPIAAEPKQPEAFVSLFDEDIFAEKEEPEQEAEKEEDFVPLWFDFDEAMKAEARQAEADDCQEEIETAPEEKPEPVQPAPKAEAVSPERKQPAAPGVERTARKRPVNATVPGKRGSNTYIPMKELSVDELFMDDQSHEAPDDYDAMDEPDYNRDIYEFEDREDGTFWQRHARGLVGMILFLVLILITGIWAFTGSGQKTLARFNIAWDAEAYAELGYAAYHQDSDRLAARYYERALARDPDNYEYAHSAMVAYYEAGDLESATAMLKKCVEMQPDNPEPYQELLIIYPDAAARPWEVTELIRTGYQRTGNESLNIG